MLLKLNLSPEKRIRYFTWLGAAAQVALVLAIMIQRLDNPEWDFINGFLIGFSIVGNLAYLYATRRLNQNADGGQK